MLCRVCVGVHAMTSAETSGPRLLLNLNEITREVEEADEYETRLTGQLDNILIDALPGFAACKLEHFDGVDHGVVLSKRYAAASHMARNHLQTVFYVLRTRKNSAALLTLQRIEAIRGTCSEDSPIAMLFLLRDAQLILTNAQLRTHNKTTLRDLLMKMESSTARCAVCDDFLYEKAVTTLACGHCLHRECYAILATVSSDVSCQACYQGDEARPNVIANMTPDAFVSQMDAVDSALSTMKVEERTSAKDEEEEQEGEEEKEGEESASPEPPSSPKPVTSITKE